MIETVVILVVGAVLGYAFRGAIRRDIAKFIAFAQAEEAKLAAEAKTAEADAKAELSAFGKKL